MAFLGDILDEPTKAAIALYGGVGAGGFTLLYLSYFFRYPPQWFANLLSKRDVRLKQEMELKAELQKVELQDRQRQREEERETLMQVNNRHQEQLERQATGHAEQLNTLAVGLTSSHTRDINRLTVSVEKLADASERNTERLAKTFEEQAKAEREQCQAQFKALMERDDYRQRSFMQLEQNMARMLEVMRVREHDSHESPTD